MASALCDFVPDAVTLLTCLIMLIVGKIVRVRSVATAFVRCAEKLKPESKELAFMLSGRCVFGFLQSFFAGLANYAANACGLPLPVASAIGNLSVVIQMIPRIRRLPFFSKIVVISALFACIGCVVVAGGDSLEGARWALIVLIPMGIGMVQAAFKGPSSFRVERDNHNGPAHRGAAARTSCSRPALLRAQLDDGVVGRRPGPWCSQRCCLRLGACGGGVDRLIEARTRA